MQKQKNKFSHLTAIERVKLSFPAQLLFEKNLLKGQILDFGCGFGNDIKLLKQKGFDIKGYDPYHLPHYPTQKFDTIICFYVLNVLFPEEQANVLMEVSHLLKPGGKVYYAVRRDIKKEGLVADLVDIARSQRLPVFNVPVAALKPLPRAAMTRRRGAYYVRFTVVDRPGVMADMTAAFRDEQVSIEALIQRGRNPGDTVPVVMTTHDTEEAALGRALARIAALKTTREPPRMIRIESL